MPKKSELWTPSRSKLKKAVERTAKETVKKTVEREGMHKKMGCKADGEDEYRSNLMVVRISSNHPTPQTAFYAPRKLKIDDIRNKKYNYRFHADRRDNVRIHMVSVAPVPETDGVSGTAGFHRPGGEAGGLRP